MQMPSCVLLSPSIFEIKIVAGRFLHLEHIILFILLHAFPFPSARGTSGKLQILKIRPVRHADTGNPGRLQIIFV
jgi:hypothetical protein